MCAIRQANMPQLAFNYLPVQFSAGGFDGGMVAFKTPEQLAEMRAALAGSHVVARDRASIVCIPIRDDADPVGTPATFARREYKALTMRLVQEALLRSVLSWGYQLRKRQPPVFVSRRPGKDLFGSALRHPYPPALDRLHVYPEYRLDARIIGPCDRPGIIVGLKTRYEIDMTVAQLLPLGLDATGRYVLTTDDTAIPDRSWRLARCAMSWARWITCSTASCCCATRPN